MSNKGQLVTQVFMMIATFLWLTAAVKNLLFDGDLQAGAIYLTTANSFILLARSGRRDG